MLPPPFIIIYYLRSTVYLYLSLKLLVLLHDGKCSKGGQPNCHHADHGGHPLSNNLILRRKKVRGKPEHQFWQWACELSDTLWSSPWSSAPPPSSPWTSAPPRCTRPDCTRRGTRARAAACIWGSAAAVGGCLPRVQVPPLPSGPSLIR